MDFLKLFILLILTKQKKKINKKKFVLELPSTKLLTASYCSKHLNLGKLKNFCRCFSYSDNDIVKIKKIFN